MENNLLIQWLPVVFCAVLMIESVVYLGYQKTRKVISLVFSVAFLVYIDIFSFFMLVFLSGIVFLCFKYQWSIQKKVFPLSLLFFLFLLIIKDPKTLFLLQDYSIPLGVSYYYFRLLAFWIDSQKNTFQKPLSALDYFSWVFCFPLLLAGPIQRFQQFKDFKYTHYQRVAAYSMLLLAILFKMVIVDGVVHFLAYQYFFRFAFFVENWPIGFCFVILFGFSAFLHAYTDLMVYTYISQRFMVILGYSYVQNFNRPLLAKNISDFWNRYHMSLSGWTRDYIFFPTLVKTKKAWLATYSSMLVMGLWHMTSLNWIFWGLLHASAINLYSRMRRTHWFQALRGRTLAAKLVSFAGNLFTLFFVSWVFILVADIDQHTSWYLFLKTLNLF